MVAIGFRMLAMGVRNLLSYALIFLVVAVVAAIFGFGGVSATAESAARLSF